MLSAVPPVEAANQLIVPALAVAPKTTVPLPHLPLFVTALIVGDAFTTTEDVTVVLQPGAETLTLYVPLPLVAIAEILGF